MGEGVDRRAIFVLAAEPLAAGRELGSG